MFENYSIKFIDDHYLFNLISSESESLIIINNSFIPIPEYLNKFTIDGSSIIKSIIDIEDIIKMKDSNKLIEKIVDLKTKKYDFDDFKNPDFLNKIMSQNPEKVSFIKNKLSKIKLFHVIIIPGITDFNKDILNKIEETTLGSNKFIDFFNYYKKIKTIDLIDYIDNNKNIFANLIKSEIFCNSIPKAKKLKKYQSFEENKSNLEINNKKDYLSTMYKEFYSIYYTLFLSSLLSKFKHSTCYILKTCINIIKLRLNNNIDFMKLPNCIIKNKIWLGNKAHAYNLDNLKFLNITHILNSTNEAENKFKEEFEYLHIIVEDYETTNISKYFLQVYEFIDKCYNDKDIKLFIHCTKGKSRSATFLVMYLMKKFNEKFEKIYDFVKENRPEIEINDGFIDQLVEFENNKFIFN